MRPDHRVPDDVASAGSELADLVRALWLATAEGARVRNDLPKLPGVTVGALQHLRSSGGMTPGQLARAMGMTRPRISDLAAKLADERLIERQPSPTDRRSIMLTVSEHGRSLLDGFRRGRYAVVDDALAQLTTAERTAIDAALPAMQRLLRAADALSDERAGRDTA